jgi:MOSC domain-containing protein YiiM
MNGRLEGIYIADHSGGAPRAAADATLVPGKGIVGDRNFSEEGIAPEKELTLVEAEQVAAFNSRTGMQIAAADVRRNLVTSGVDLNRLVGCAFSIGDVIAEGIELCEPCATLGRCLATENVPAARVVAEFAHRAGLRARIVQGGVIRAGDAIATQ